MAILIISILISVFGFLMMVMIVGNRIYLKSNGRYFRIIFHDLLGVHIPRDPYGERTVCTVCGSNMIYYNGIWIIQKF